MISNLKFRNSNFQIQNQSALHRISRRLIPTTISLPVLGIRSKRESRCSNVNPGRGESKVVNYGVWVVAEERKASWSFWAGLRELSNTQQTKRAPAMPRKMKPASNIPAVRKERNDP